MESRSSPRVAAAASWLTGFSLLAALPGIAGAAPPAPLDVAVIEKLTGARGKMDPVEGVFRVSAPRDDLRVTVGEVRIPPAMGLTSWAAFQGSDVDARVMGDLVLLEDQVNPVMDAALDAGLQVTALHNHFLRDSPRVLFMHIGGMGDVQTLAAAVGKVFARIAATSGGKGDRPAARIDPDRGLLDPARLDAELGLEGALGDGVYRVAVGRRATMEGMKAGNAMGVGTWAAFAGSDTRAVVDGDFAVLEDELQPVLKALRAARIDVVAIHQHMTGEVPRILFVHYWGVGPSRALARGIRSALDRTSAPRGER